MRDLASQINPKVVELLQQTVDSAGSGDGLPNNLVQFLDVNLIYLRDRLSSVNFDRMLAIMWRIVSDTLFSMVKEAVSGKRSKVVFSILHNSFKVLINFFHGDDIPIDDPNLLVTNRRCSNTISKGGSSPIGL